MTNASERANGAGEKPRTPQERHRQLSDLATQLVNDYGHKESGRFPLSTGREIAVFYQKTNPVPTTDPKTGQSGSAFLIQSIHETTLVFEPQEDERRRAVYVFGNLGESPFETLAAAKWRNVANAGLAEQYLGQIEASLVESTQTPRQVGIS